MLAACFGGRGGTGRIRGGNLGLLDGSFAAFWPFARAFGLADLWGFGGVRARNERAGLVVWPEHVHRAAPPS